jgi:hypothetical protein
MFLLSLSLSVLSPSFVYVTSHTHPRRFYLILNKRQWDGENQDDGSDDSSLDPFGTISESFITLFRMMLGDFDREWFMQRTSHVDTYTTLLFVVYMIIVFIVMLNVLIAVVCDNYDYAMSKSRELFLRTRLTLVAGLELQGYTVKRPKVRGNNAVSDSTEISSRQSFGAHRASRSSMAVHVVNGRESGASNKEEKIPLSVRLTGLSGSDRLDRALKLTLWHRAMRKLLQLRYMFEEVGGQEDWNGRVKHLEREVSNIVNKRVSQAEEKLIRAFEQHMERRDAMMLAQQARGMVPTKTTSLK